MDSFDTRVQQGRKALARARDGLWELAGIAATFPPSEGNRFVRGAADRAPQEQGLSEWAQAIGISPRRAQEYRQTALAWPVEQRRMDRSFQLHVELAGDDNRFERIDEVAKLRDLRPVEDEVAIAKRVLLHPERAEEVMADPVVDRAAFDASVQVHRERQGIKRPTKQDVRQLHDSAAESERNRHRSGMVLNSHLVKAMSLLGLAVTEAEAWLDEMPPHRVAEHKRTIIYIREKVDTLTEQLLAIDTDEDVLQAHLDKLEKR